MLTSEVTDGAGEGFGGIGTNEGRIGVGVRLPPACGDSEADRGLEYCWKFPVPDQAAFTDGLFHCCGAGS